MKATEQYFPVVLFIMLYKVALNFESGWNPKVWPWLSWPSTVQGLKALTVGILIRITRIVFQYSAINDITKLLIHVNSNIIAHANKQVNKICLFPKTEDKQYIYTSYSVICHKNFLMVSCLMKNLTRKMKLKNVTQRLGVSNITIKSEKCYVLKLFKELKFEWIGPYLCMLHY